MKYWLFLQADPEQVRCMHWCRYDGANWMQEEGEPNDSSWLQHQAADALEVILVLPAQRVLLTEVILPAQVEADAQTLAYALEDRLTKEAHELVITRLTLPLAASAPFTEKILPGHHPLAVFDRSLLLHIQSYALNVGLTAFKLTVDCLMLPLTPGQWSVWQSPQGAVARFAALDGMGLMAGAEGFLLQHRLKACIRENRAPEAIAFFGHLDSAASAEHDVQSWGINLPLHYHKLDTATLLSAPIISLLPTPSSLGEQWRRLLVPLKALQQGLLRPVLVLILLAALLLLTQQWQLRQEFQALQSTINHHFRQVFTQGEEKSLDVVAQMEERVRQTHGGQDSATQGFTPLMLRFIAAMKQSPDFKPQTLRYEKNSLTLTLAQPISPAALAQLQTQWPAGRVTANGKELTISPAAQPNQK